MATGNYFINLNTSYGFTLVSTFVATALWGMTCLQTKIYFETYGTDGWCLKTIIILLWLLDTIHEILCIQGLWTSIIVNFDPFKLGPDIPLGITWQVLVTGMVATLSQGFFTWRIWRVANKKWVFPIILVPLTLTQMIISILFVKKPPIEDLYSFGSDLYMLMLSVILTVTDVLIAAIMCTLLRQGRTGFRSTDRLILRLVNAAVATGVLTALTALFAGIMTIIGSSTLVCFLAEIPLCTMYCNAVLANLNSRRYLQGPIIDVDISLNRISTGPVMQIASSSEASPREGRETPHEAGIID